MGSGVSVAVGQGYASPTNPFPSTGGYAYDSTGEHMFHPESLAQVLTYDEAGQLQTVTVGPDSKGRSFRQTYTHTDGRVTGITAWVML